MLKYEDICSNSKITFQEMSDGRLDRWTKQYCY